MTQKLGLILASASLSLMLNASTTQAEVGDARLPGSQNPRIHVQNPLLGHAAAPLGRAAGSAPAGGFITPANPDTRARLDYLTGELSRNARGERLWWYGWIGGFAALSAGQAYFFFTKDEPEERVLNAVGGGMSFIGLVGLLVLPNDGRFADENLAELPDATPEARVRKLERAEAMLHSAREATWRKRNPLAVIGPLLVSFGTSAYVWIKYDAALPALRNMAGALAINLAHWWTRPTANAEAAQLYRGESAGIDWRLTPWISPSVAGLGLAAAF